MRSFIGQTIDAITLKDSCGAGALALDPSGFVQERFTEALTDNYLKLHLKGCHQPNRWLRAQMEVVRDGALVGNVVQ